MANAAFLTDRQFRALAEAGHPVTDPFEVEFIRAASVDLRLGSTAYRYRFDSYHLGQEISDADYEHESFESLPLEPSQSAFVGLDATIKVPTDCVGFIFPRSSITRLGLVIPPVYMNPGYSGKMPLTIINNSPFKVELVPRVRVAQLVCARLDQAPAVAYHESEASKYLGEQISPSRLHTDDEIRSALERVLTKSFPSHLFQNLAAK
jgi:dCTP deaminase